MKCIIVDSVSYRYPKGRDYALKDVNVEISEGEFVLIVGPSGSGKSTFVRLLNGLIPHYYGGEFNGRVVVFGVDTRERSVAELSKTVGIVFQDPENQLLTLTVEKEVAFGPENLGLPPREIRRRVEESLKTMSILHLRDRLPFELSGGEQQKVVVASILALNPKVLVFDEPTSNMDPLSAMRFIEAVRELHSRGYTIIIVEHRLDLIVPYATRMLVFDRGRLVGDGTIPEMLERGILEDVGVDVPRIPLTFKLLRERIGVKLGLPLTIEDAVRLIRGVYNGG